MWFAACINAGLGLEIYRICHKIEILPDHYLLHLLNSLICDTFCVFDDCRQITNVEKRAFIWNFLCVCTIVSTYSISFHFMVHNTALLYSLIWTTIAYVLIIWSFAPRYLDDCEFSSLFFTRFLVLHNFGIFHSLLIILHFRGSLSTRCTDKAGFPKLG